MDQSAIFFSLTILALALGLFGCGVLSAKTDNKHVEWICIILICMGVSIVSGVKTGAFVKEEFINKQLTKDVQHVDENGKSNFYAQIHVVYEEGELKSIGLVPNTTKVVE